MDEKDTVAVERYDGDPDEWEYGDATVGYNVPDSVRDLGAYRPMLKRELSGNGTAYESHSVKYRCEGCGAVRRFASNSMMIQYWCQECSAVRWFKFSWGLNR